MRNITIDIAKGIGILTVVLCHNWIVYHESGALSRIIFSFHMPLFFFISGVFFKPQLSFKETIKSKAHGLLKPYFLVVTLLISYMFIKNLNGPSNFNFINEVLKVIYSGSPTLDWVQLWFLTHLFAIFIFAWILERFFLSKILYPEYYLLALALMFWLGIDTIKLFWEIPIDPFRINQNIFENAFGSTVITYNGKPMLLGLPYNLDILLVTTPIFLSGYFLSEKIKKFQPSYFWFVACLLIFIFSHVRYDFTMALHKREYDNIIVTSAEMITGIYLTFAFSHLLSRVPIVKELLAYIGKASLFILIFHFAIQHYITGSVNYHLPQYNYTAASIGFVGSVLISLATYEIINRSPWLQHYFMYLPKK